LTKATSAGILPALVVAALLTGCGGGSGEQTTASTAESTATAKSPNKATSARAKAPSPAEEEQAKAAAKVKAEAKTGKADKSSGKHGPSIAQPKGEQEPAISPQQREESNVADIALSSPVAPSGSPLPATYTCDGKDTWPTLEWEGVPGGTEELVLFAMNIKPVNEAIFFDWAVGSLDPSSTGIEAGKLSAGAVVGKNSTGKVGYSICPPKGTDETIMFVLYALPKALGAKQGFDPLALREEVDGAASNSGLLAVSYARE